MPPARSWLFLQDGVASMTAQRALRELQQRGLTYAVARKGTFVHRMAAERLETNADGHPTARSTALLITAGRRAARSRRPP
jgi:DNA-binding GntR family transcriptional regulator